MATLATIGVIGLFFVLFNCSGMILPLIRTFFRLDGPRKVAAPVRRSDQDQLDIAAGKLSESEADLIAKYGAATDDVYSDDRKD